MYGLMSHSLLRADLMVKKKKGLGFEESKEGSAVQALLFYSRFYLGTLNW